MARNPPGSNDVSDIQITFGWSNGPAEAARGTELFEQDVSQFGDARCRSRPDLSELMSQR